MQNRIVKLNNIIAILKTANCNCICTIARTFRRFRVIIQSIWCLYLVRSARSWPWHFLQSYPQKQTRERLVCKAAWEIPPNCAGSLWRVPPSSRFRKDSRHPCRARSQSKCQIYRIHYAGVRSIQHSDHRESDHFRLNALESPKNRIRQNFYSTFSQPDLGQRCYML